MLARSSFDSIGKRSYLVEDHHKPFMPNSPNKLSQIWQELKRRRVIKVIAMYAATAFIIMESADIMLPRLGLPDWTVTLVIVLLIVGLPVAIILSWIFDLTPGGIKRTEAEKSTTLTPDTDKKPRRGLKISEIIIMTLFVVVCILLYPKIFAEDKFKEFRDSDGRISVAVMPFDNLTGDSSNDFWQNGISEYLINDLGSSEELIVVSTQVMKEVFGTTNQVSSASISPIMAREVAGKINAQTYLTGKFIGEMNNVSILLNMVSTNSGELVWSCRVEGDLGNRYQDLLGRLADTVRNYLEIRALEEKVSPELSQVFPNSSEAFKHYINGMQAFTRMDFQTARSSLIRALEIDSTFTFATFYLAWVAFSDGQFSGEWEVWIHRAHELKYSLPIQYQTWIDLWYAYVNEDLEAIRNACSVMERSDIQSRYYWFDLAITYYYDLLDVDKAYEAFRKVEEINKQWHHDWEFAEYYGFYIELLLKTGRLDEMDRITDKAQELNLENWRIIVGLGAKSLLDNDTAAFEKYKVLIRDWNIDDVNPEASNAHDIGEMYEWIEDYGTAKIYFSKAYELDPGRNRSLIQMIRAELKDNGSPGKCLELVDEALLRDPENSDFLWLKGYVLHKLQRSEEALLFLKKADERFNINQMLKNDIREVEEALGI
jgi:TolB-like protein